jgi:aryl-alcohol dehydrogenase-like predicted oxidoreductase
MVGEIGLGGMPLSISRDRASEADSVRVLLAAADAGITLWDTANAYCIDDTETGHNERLFRQAYGQLPADSKEQVVIATKGGHVRTEGRWDYEGNPEALRKAIDASLESLGLDCIPLYQFHRPDPNVPIEDSLGALEEARQAGKIKHVGVSNFSVEQIERGLKVTPFISVQNRYSLGVRTPEEDGVLAKCKELGLAFLPYSPLGGIKAAKGEGVSSAESIADELGVSPQRVALAWLLTKYDRMIPIPGFSRIESAEDSAKATDVVLSPDQLARLNAQTGA